MEVWIVDGTAATAGSTASATCAASAFATATTANAAATTTATTATTAAVGQAYLVSSGVQLIGDWLIADNRSEKCAVDSEFLPIGE